MKAVIFDFDGVIADTNALHGIVESDVLKRNGYEISPDELRFHYGGVPFWDKLSMFLGDKGLDLKALNDEKEDRMLVEAKEIKPMDGAVKLIKLLHSNGYKLAVGTSARKSFFEMVMNDLGLMHYFQVVVTLDDVKKGKPAPDIFMKAAELLEVDYKDCIVIEDGMSGIEAARTAGMKSIFLKADDSQKCNPNKIVWSLTELTLDDF